MRADDLCLIPGCGKSIHNDCLCQQHCKEWRAEYNREELAARRKAYYEANREEVAARQKAYYEANREELAARRKAYYEANREEVAARRKAYREEVAARQKARERDYAALDELVAQRRRWREKNRV